MISQKGLKLTINKEKIKKYSQFISIKDNDKEIFNGNIKDYVDIDISLEMNSHLIELYIIKDGEYYFIDDLIIKYNIFDKIDESKFATAKKEYNNFYNNLKEICRI